MEGEVENIVAKKRAFKLASSVEGVEGVMDRLRVVPSEHRGDGAILNSLTDALLQEPALTPFTLRVRRKGEAMTLHESAERRANRACRQFISQAPRRGNGLVDAWLARRD